MTGPGYDPFAVLGLPATPVLSDEDVRAAWRERAAATHPDRADGGNPDAYREASAAFALLRSPWGRTEAYADLGRPPPGTPAGQPSPPMTVLSYVRPAPAQRVPVPWTIPARVARGRPGRLALRILVAAGIAVAAWFSGAGLPPVTGVLAGVLVWLVRTGGNDLAPPPGR